MNYKNLFPKIGERLMALDIETLGTNSRAPVLSIGYVVLVVEREVLCPCLEQHVAIDLTGFEKYFDWDYSTLKWWMKQDAEARDVMFGDTAVNIVNALGDLACHYSNPNRCDESCQQVWTRHPTFDITILNHAFGVVNRKAPWHYRHPRDTATISCLVPQQVRDELELQFTQHDALEDAKYEAGVLQELYKLAS